MCTRLGDHFASYFLTYKLFVSCAKISVFTSAESRTLHARAYLDRNRQEHFPAANCMYDTSSGLYLIQ